jgi:hypothetical protein
LIFVRVEIVLKEKLVVMESVKAILNGAKRNKKKMLAFTKMKEWLLGLIQRNQLGDEEDE